MKLHNAVAALVALSLGSGSARAGRISVTPAASNAVLHEQKVTLGYDALSVDSDFPASSLRYNDNQYLHGATPIFENELVVAVTSDCSEQELGGTPIVTYKFMDEPEGVKPHRVRSVQIRRNNGTTTADIDDLSFLETSVFEAEWTYESYWCNQYDQVDNGPSGVSKLSKSAIQDETLKQALPQDSESAAGNKSGFIITAATLIMGLFLGSGGTAGEGRGRSFTIFATTVIAVWMVQGSQNTTSDNTTAAGTSMCKINLELLHDGCRFTPLTVTAPAARVADVVLENQQSIAPEDDCTTYYKADLTFPKSTLLKNASSTDLPQIDHDQCYRMVEGRPFIDQSGTQIQAMASSSAARGNGWCTATNDDHNNKQENKQDSPQAQREALGQEWTRRALGEHASVASFAAFTIALMSNNAPPQLIQDSLTAAADEVRHARVSFEAASQFLGRPVEPGPLPATAHNFQYNLTALALATAQEGCIDETLSALLAALEVDELLSPQPMEQVSEEERQWLKDSMRTIALEEANHSALAWRTIQWVCAKDVKACEAVQSTLFDPEHLKAAVQQRLEGRPFSLQKVEMAWEKVHTTLIPVVTRRVGSIARNEAEETNALTELIPQTIIEGVMSPGMASIY